MSRALVRLLLRLYPADFRDRFGADLEGTFERLLDLHRTSDTLTRTRTIGRALADMFAGLFRERLRLWRGKKRVSRDTGVGTQSRTKRGWGTMMSGWVRDLRWAVRGMARQPLFTLVAAGSLAIGIGANTAVFSVANTLLLQPLPGIPNYDRVVDLGRTSSGGGFDTFAYPDFEDIRAEVGALEDAAAYTLEIMSVSRDSEGIRASGMLVSASYFNLLGAVPHMGRFFRPEEDIGFDQHPVAVVSGHFWRERLGAAVDAIGSTLLVNRVTYTIVGVTDEDFQGHIVGFSPDVYLPLMQAPIMSQGQNNFSSRKASWLLAIGLRTPTASTGEVNVQLEAISHRLAEAYPESNSSRGFAAVPLGPIPGGGRGDVQLFMTALVAMVGLILLVTCMNIAGMFLARAVSREREVAVRRAIGAGRGTVVQQLTIETLVVFLLGGGIGIALGYWGVGLLRPDLLPTPIPLRFSVEPDPTVTLVALAVTLGTGLVFGLLPALRATGLDLAGAMRAQDQASGRKGMRLRTIFAAGQVGLSLILLVTAGLFVRSLQRAGSIDTGFDPVGALVSYIDLSLEGYDDATGPAFQISMLESLRSRAWVSAASLSTDLPLDLSSSGTAVLPEGWSEGDERRLSIHMNRVSAGYFETLQIPLLAGRPIESGDIRGTRQVVVVSEHFANLAWPGEEALGKSIYQGRTDEPDGRYEVVGIAGNVKNVEVTEQLRAFVYFPLAQRYSGATQLVVRPSETAADAPQLLREALAEADADMSKGPIVTLESFTSLGRLPQRIAASLTSALALVALLLSGLGIYGVVSFSVGRKRREIGIRMALGADPGELVSRLVRGGVLLTIPGLLLGAVASIGVGRLVQALLLDLSPFDPLALGSVSVLLLGVVVLAAWIPARRAALVDPAESLRRE